MGALICRQALNSFHLPDRSPSLVASVTYAPLPITKRLHDPAAQARRFVTEAVVTNHEPFDYAEGWGRRVKRPDGPGWRVADYSSKTRWKRRLFPSRRRL